MRGKRVIYLGLSVMTFITLSWLLLIPLPRLDAITGQAQIGGAFTLTTSNGKVVRDGDLKGKVSILYFGATVDDGISVAALTILAAALQRVDRRADAVAVYFITLDPDFDTLDRTQLLLGKHLPRAVALTGNTSEIKELAGKFKLYFKKILDPALPMGYIVDHASLYYILDPDGAFAALVPYTTELSELVREISRHIR
jgi:cytochrome oxidase Cu insertion factor (SCO1/SenC/PrrC family)